MPDLPDFWRSDVINIITQDLAEVINRPKYGGATNLKGSQSCTKDEWTELFAFTGKGMIYGGWVSQYFSNNDGYSSIRLTIDASDYANYTFAVGKDLKSEGVFVYPIYSTIFDSGNNLYESAFSYGITFETSVKVEVYNLGNTGSFSYEFHYALV